MKYYPIPLVISFLLLTFCFAVSQNQSATSNHPFNAPSRNLSPTEILEIEGIHSLHYAEYFVEAPGGLDSCCKLEYELFFDKYHMKQINYDPVTITGWDLKRRIMWNYLYGKLTYPKGMNLQFSYDLNIQAFLGSWLKPPITFLRTEKIGTMDCDVFSDESGTREWIWKDHHLPVQRKVRGLLCELTHQKRIIEINRPLPDSLFKPPKQ